MILYRLGPNRLSPSLVVWQVRQALLNTCCPDAASARWCTCSCPYTGDNSRYVIPLSATSWRTQSLTCGRASCRARSVGDRFISHLIDDAIVPFKCGFEVLLSQGHAGRE